MRTLIASILLLALCSPPAVARERGPDELVRAAREMSEKGAQALALQLYLKALDRLDALGPDRQAALLRGIFQTSRTLLDQESYQAGIRGLTALLAPTRSGMATKLGLQVRRLLDQTALGLVIEGQPGQALVALNALTEDGPGGPLRWALMVRAYLELGIHDKAENTLKRALSLYPDAPELLFARATLAATRAKRAVSQSVYSRAEALLREAADDLKQAIGSAPHQAGIQRALGKIRGSLWLFYQATGQHPENFRMLEAAEVAYSEAARLDLRDPQAPFELGRLLFTAGDWVWAKVWFQEAQKRIRAFLQRELPKSIRDSTRARLQECLHFLASTYYHRAVDAANTGHFRLARELVHGAARQVPAYRSKSSELLAWLITRRREFEREVKRLGGMDGSGDARVALGDLWMRVRDYPRARRAYRQALGLPRELFSDRQVQGRLYGTRRLEGKAETSRLSAGGLEVELEYPQGLEPSLLQSLLHKAHAITMGIFPHRLNGPLGIKVFANRRAYLETSGPRAGSGQGGHYVFGRIVTFQEPGRLRGQWLDILVHEICHRYVDEMTYHQAPRWLYEGVARWAGQRWSTSDQVRLQKLAEADRLVPWNDMEEQFVRNWNQPETIDRLYLQSHHMVHWLIALHDQNRLMVLMAFLRDGRPLEQALTATYGMPTEEIQKRWLEELRR